MIGYSETGYRSHRWFLRQNCRATILTSAYDTPPKVVDDTAHRHFCELAAQYGVDVNSRFVGGYVEHEWARIRHVLERICPVADRSVLEFGCNIGATSIVADRLGAFVTGIDTDRNVIPLAIANAARFGARNCRFVHLAETRRLPFEDQAFDVVCCNSVLEYVLPSYRNAVLSELERVLRPAGILVFHGTSNSFWPREVHSRSFLGNWLPTWLSPRATRGINPLSIRRAFVGYDDLLMNNRKAFVDIKAKQNMSRFTSNIFAITAAALRLSPGMLLRSFMLVLRKPVTLSPWNKEG